MMGADLPGPTGTEDSLLRLEQEEGELGGRRD